MIIIKDDCSYFDDEKVNKLEKFIQEELRIHMEKNKIGSDYIFR